LTGQVEEVYGGHIVVKAYNREKDEIKQFSETNEKLYRSAYMAHFVSGIIMPIMNFIGNLGYIFVAVAGGILVTRNAITVGDIQAFIQYSRQLNQPIVQIANIANMIQSTLAAAERVSEIMEKEEETPDRPDAIELDRVEGNVKFESVRFSLRSREATHRELKHRCQEWTKSSHRRSNRCWKDYTRKSTNEIL